MIHATVMALAMIRGNLSRDTISGMDACDPSHPSHSSQAFAHVDAALFVSDMIRTQFWPTCPKCLVLLDQALEQSTRAGA